VFTKTEEELTKEVNNWVKKTDQIHSSLKAAVNLLDAAGRPLKVGDTVAYAISLGRSPSMQIATIVCITDKRKIQLQIIEKHRQTWGKKPIVTVQYPDRMVILEPLDV